MKRAVLSLLALGVLVAAICWPVIAWNRNLPTVEDDEPTRIVAYDATFDISADGTMWVREEVSVLFPGYPARHGIFRFFDRADDNAPRLRRDPGDIAVLMDGRPVEFELNDESHGRYEVVKIGSAATTVAPGVHTYRIVYTIDDVLLPEPDGSRFYWNLVPGGWRQSIEDVRLEVNLPGPVEGTRCAVGEGRSDGCTVRGDGTQRLVVTAERLGPRTPVTVSTSVDHEVAEPAAERSWAARWDPVLGDRSAVFLLVLAGALASGLAALALVRSTLEPQPPFPLVYAPPEGLSPAQAEFILTERIDRRAFVATLMHLAERGLVDLDLEHDAGGWRIAARSGGDLSTLDEVSRDTAHLLGLPVAVFHASPDSPTDGQTLKTAIDGFDASTRSWARAQGLLTSAGPGSLGGVLVLMAAVAAAGLIVFNPLGMTASALVPGAFAAGGLGLLVPGASTRRTASGRDLWSRAGGFRRVLSTTSSQQRFEFSGREELYTAYLPWAVAFGVADQWAAKYRTEMGTEPPLPRYFAGGYAGSHTANHVTQMVNDFDHTVSSAISSYEATQRSSSGSGGGGGGGGFSGGGGGGGGGGGSW